MMKGRLILEENCDGKGGFIAVDIDELTPEFLDKIKADKENKKGWKKYHKVMKEAGYPIE